MNRTLRWLPVIVILLCSFKQPETGIGIATKNGATILTIYPLIDDSTSYIRREFVRTKYCREEVFSHGKRILLTTFNSYKGELGYDEFVYSHDSGQERMVLLREYHHGNNEPARKTILLQDSTIFGLHYYPNGNIKSCAVETSFCKKYNGYEFDEDNLQYSTGRFSPQVRYDTVSTLEEGMETQTIRVFCGNKTGIWRSYDFGHKLVGTRNFD